MSQMEDTYFNAIKRMKSGKTKEEASKILYRALRKMAKLDGQQQDVEVSLSPLGYGVAPRSIQVIWEANPINSDWGVHLQNHTFSKEWYLECYWGCDVLFKDI